MTATAQHAILNHATSEKNEYDYSHMKIMDTMDIFGRVVQPLPGLGLVTIFIAPVALPIVAEDVVRLDAP